MDVWQTRKGLSSPTTTLLPELPPKKLKHPTKELRGRIFEHLKFDLCTDRTFVLFLQNLLLSLLQNLYLRNSNFAARTMKTSIFSNQSHFECFSSIEKFPLSKAWTYNFKESALDACQVASFPDKFWARLVLFGFQGCRLMGQL